MRLLLTSPKDKPALDPALSYASALFMYHAQQRMQALNFFLAMSGLLAAGYGGTIQAEVTEAAIILGSLGAALTVLFALLDLRNKELVCAAEDALKVLEARLAHDSGYSELAIVARTDGQRAFLRTHSTILPALQVVMFAAFVTMVSFAMIR